MTITDPVVPAPTQEPKEQDLLSRFRAANGSTGDDLLSRYRASLEPRPTFDQIYRHLRPGDEDAAIRRVTEGRGFFSTAGRGAAESFGGKNTPFGVGSMVEGHGIARFLYLDNKLHSERGLTREEELEHVEAWAEMSRDKGVREMAGDITGMMPGFAFEIATGVGAGARAAKLATAAARTAALRIVRDRSASAATKALTARIVRNEAFAKAIGAGVAIGGITGASEAVPRLWGMGGGRWTAYALQKALPQLQDMTPEDWEAAEGLANDALVKMLATDLPVWQGALDTLIEVGSEFAGGTIAKGMRSTVVGSKILAAQALVFEKIAGRVGNRGADFLDDLARRTKFEGPIIEFLEERLGDVLRVSTGLEGSETLIPEVDELAAEVLALSFPSLGAAAVRRATGAHKRAIIEAASEGDFAVPEGTALPSLKDEEVLARVEQRLGAPGTKIVEPTSPTQKAATDWAAMSGRRLVIVDPGEGATWAGVSFDPDLVIVNRREADPERLAAHELTETVGLLSTPEERAEQAEHLERIKPGILDRAFKEWQADVSAGGQATKGDSAKLRVDEGAAVTSEWVAPLMMYAARNAEARAAVSRLAEGDKSGFWARLWSALRDLVGRPSSRSKADAGARGAASQVPGLAGLTEQESARLALSLQDWIQGSSERARQWRVDQGVPKRPAPEAEELDPTPMPGDIVNVAGQGLGDVLDTIIENGAVKLRVRLRPEHMPAEPGPLRLGKSGNKTVTVDASEAKMHERRAPVGRRNVRREQREAETVTGAELTTGPMPAGFVRRRTRPVSQIEAGTTNDVPEWDPFEGLDLPLIPSVRPIEQSLIERLAARTPAQRRADPITLVDHILSLGGFDMRGLGGHNEAGDIEEMILGLGGRRRKGLPAGLLYGVNSEAKARGLTPDDMREALMARGFVDDRESDLRITFNNLVDALTEELAGGSPMFPIGERVYLEAEFERLEALNYETGWAGHVPGDEAQLDTPPPEGEPWEWRFSPARRSAALKKQLELHPWLPGMFEESARAEGSERLGRAELLRIINEGGAIPSEGISTLIEGFARELVPGFNMVGQKVTNALDAALLFATLRSPLVERFSWMLVAPDGTVVDSAIYSVGSVGAAYAPSTDESFAGINAAAKARGKPGEKLTLWVSHNHPSGNTEPSTQDVNAYRSVAEVAASRGLAFRGIITNGSSYAVWNNGSESFHQKMANLGESLRLGPLPRISGIPSAISYARSLESLPGMSIAIGVNSRGEVVAVKPVDNASDGKWIDEWAVSQGASGVFLAGESGGSHDTMRFAMRSKAHIVDVITLDNPIASAVARDQWDQRWVAHKHIGRNAAFPPGTRESVPDYDSDIVSQAPGGIRVAETPASDVKIEARFAPARRQARKISDVLREGLETDMHEVGKIQNEIWARLGKADADTDFIGSIDLARSKAPAAIADLIDRLVKQVRQFKGHATLDQLQRLAYVKTAPWRNAWLRVALADRYMRARLETIEKRLKTYGKLLDPKQLGRLNGEVKAIEKAMAMDEQDRIAYAMRRGVRIPLSPSGIDNLRAAGELARLRAQIGPERADSFLEWIREENRSSLDVEVASGMLDAAAARKWHEREPYWISMRDIDANLDDAAGYTQPARSFSVGDVYRRADGREEELETALQAWLEDKIRRREAAARNEALNVAAALARSDDAAHGLEVLTNPPSSEQAPYAVQFFERGRKRWLLLPTLGAAEALKGLHGRQVGEILGLIGKGTRFFSRMVTSQNPTFWLPNFLRDTSQAFWTIGAEGSFREGAQVVARAWSLLPSAVMAAVGKTGKHSELIREATLAGVKTTWVGVHSLKEQLQVMVDALSDQTGPTNFVRRTLHFFENMSDAFEVSTRVAVFEHERRQNGKDNREAALRAKNITINFDRKGTLTPSLAALYSFFNPAVQGSLRIINAATSTKRGLAVTAATIGLGMIWEGLSYALSDDDELTGLSMYGLLADWSKERNLHLPFSVGGVYLTYPMAYGIGSIFSMGRRMTHLVSPGLDPRMTPAKVLHDSVWQALNEFQPFGGLSNPVVALTPTILRPVTELQTNEKFGERRIMRDKTSFGEELPDSARAFSTIDDRASGWLGHKIANALNMGGPEDLETGLDVSPETAQHLIEFVTSGFGLRELDRLSQFAMSSRDVPVLPNTPFLRNFTNSVNSIAVSDEYYRLRERSERVWKRATNAVGEARGEALARDPVLHRMAPAFRAQDRRLRVLQNRIGTASVEDRLELQSERLRIQSEMVQRFYAQEK